MTHIHSGLVEGPDLLPLLGRLPSAADRALCALGVRPVKISQYCAAVALHRPDLPSNPWCRVLRTYFEFAPAGRSLTPAPREARDTSAPEWDEAFLRTPRWPRCRTGAVPTSRGMGSS